ncbi:hypothetical protein N9Z67_02175 [Rhodopirellula sp.]|nr:hypothetical protein [Rhodopirellula sp.]
MKRIVTHMSLLAATAILATGCVPVRHNLPPEQQLMEPGPGVGGPGPGVLGAPSVAPGMMGASMMGNPMMGGPSMRGPMGGPMMAPPMMQAPTPAAPPAAPMPDTSAGVAVGDIDLVNYSACAPNCQNCGGAGCNLLGRRSGGMSIPPGAGILPSAGMMPAVPPTLQVTLAQPEGMQVRYDASGSGGFDSEPLVVPARQNFPQGGLYRLKLTNIPAREGVELYPTVELAYANPRTGAYLAHNSVPLQFTEEDFDQVLTGNFVTKVIYLPDPDFQGPALAGIDTLVSTRLDPGIDPIVEADRRGSILAIIRLGDKDIEMSGSNEMLTAGGVMRPPFAGLPSAFAPAMTEGCGNCPGNGAPMPPALPGMISGVNTPQYGMPMTGTPIGLPGPPHIPLGQPAGLKKHVMRNHTSVNIPRPVEKVKMNVRMQPGYSYPNPVSRVRITEQNIHSGGPAPRGAFQPGSQLVQ